MPTTEEIKVEKERLYESASLRDDLNDPEAEVLLKWGEAQVERIALEYPHDFEQSCRFMRQVLKNINRFVGQREFNEREGQAEYLGKVTMYFPKLAWEHITEEQLFAAMPEDKTDMAGTLNAILNLLTPPNASTASPESLPPNTESAALADNPPDAASMSTSIDLVENPPSPSEIGGGILGNLFGNLVNSLNNHSNHEESTHDEEND